MSDTDDTTRMSVAQVYERYQSDNKKLMKKIHLPGFLGGVAFMIPAYCFIVPLTILYQGSKFLLKSTRRAELPYSAAGGENEGDGDVTETFPAPKDLTPHADRKYDLILLGCTGYTGGLATEYLCQQYGISKDVKWAIAGRSQSKLNALKQKLADQMDDPGLIKNLDTVICDTSKRSTLHALASNTRAVISTAGPFYAYGSAVVEFCARYGTHYADITGEVDWSQQMITKYDAIARSTGAKIVSFCGHDSVPWDLSTAKLADILKAECDDDLISVQFFDETMGKPSGGTLATACLAIDRLDRMPKYDYDPFYQVTGKRSHFKTKVTNPQLPVQCSDGHFKDQWTAPFVMADVNGAVVKRSNALRGMAPVLKYQESMTQHDFKNAVLSAMGLGLGVVALLNPLTGSFIKNYVFPKPGEGPSEKDLQRSFLLISGVGVGAKGNVAESVFYFPKDAGYYYTSRMLVESGLCLAMDDLGKNTNTTSGFLTPATAMGDALLKRLVGIGASFACEIRSRM
eukprot:CAMPEP_0196820482 /NCGR_PEP_ID=MMETSP1362-20130617/75494_1 /TAXON_ID=163516 /ORGANISM="Leptocylindrus danicus, Strain CCMP1856" /LENGTH=513 /DNA_ID=CAMNT_0042199387 /DNA_START=257 /DNA_END=1798 /DNA_ORIENTATION=+